MKVLFLINDGEALFKLRKELIDKLIKDNNEVFVSLPKDIYETRIKNLGCTFIDTSINRKGTNPLTDINLFLFYIKFIKKIKPNIVLSYTIKPNIYGGFACRILNTPFIATITGLGSAIENGGILQVIALLMYKISLKSACKVFFQNSTNMNFLIKKRIVKVKQSELVPGSGVNIDDYKVYEYPSSKTVDFVYIGRMMEEKGFGHYLDAAKYIKAKYQNTRFHVAGLYEDDYRNVVEELIKQNIIIYHGSVINMAEQIYKNISCTVHPTYYAEGLSNVLLESLSCGRPIITTNRPGCGEIIEDKVNGFVVKQKDTNDLIKVIEKFLSLSRNQQKQMGLEGRRKIEKEFDRRIVIDKYLIEINKCK